MRSSKKPKGERGMRDRRRHPRVETSHPVLFYSDIYPKPKVAATLDLSPAGARIKTSSLLMKREGLDISIAIQPQVIKCRATVVYVLDSDAERTTVGIQFEDLSQEDGLSLRRYLTSLTEHEA
jgi:hypothetical protein